MLAAPLDLSSKIKMVLPLALLVLFDSLFKHLPNAYFFPISSL